ncbi:hypothetical protein GXB81_18125 [Paraburkholderia sp. Ac-20336]|uniref:hypothetical protein n=1 Tax=Paraburkholderia sp. Ac-20336 TaxID=2703886 RepID=UPI00197CBEA7|nr:hypothetical protein [Paraburkholderia sp. Ac-20336]MBN3804953.1 hypothetical protein [Paraburkholderia sp. Ac-20336]
MNELERQQEADEAYHERWTARYGFVPPADQEHPITKKFWELEEAWHVWHTAFAWRQFQRAVAETGAVFAVTDVS